MRPRIQSRTTKSNWGRIVKVKTPEIKKFFAYDGKGLSTIPLK